MITLYEADGHRNVMFDDLSSGSMVQANQHVIVDGKEGMVLDPGGHKVYTKLFSQMSGLMPPNGLKHIFFSHQDPDIIAAANGWLMVTDARAHLSSLWMRFIPHFGVDELVVDRITPIEDGGATLDLNGKPIKIVPAHFLHSAGNFQVYDTVAKILYTGDLGASLGADYPIVKDFEAHVQYMEGFHRRYMPSSKVMKMWAAMARSLDVETIAPQHGAVMQGRETVGKFIDWIDGLACGVDLLGDSFAVPA